MLPPNPSSLEPPLRIMQLVSSPTTSGPCVHVLQLSEQLRSLGHEVTVVARPNSWVAEEARRANFPTILSDLQRFPPSELWRLKQEVRDRGIQLLHSHMSRAHFMGVLLRGLCQIPCIATAHCRKIQAHWTWNNHVIATSRDTELFHRRYNWVPERNISTIYCPTPQRSLPAHHPTAQTTTAQTTTVTGDSLYDARVVRQYRQQWGCSPTQTEAVIGVVGEISPAKGQSDLLTAIQHLRAAGRPIRLVIVGNHRREHVWELQRQARDAGIGSAIHWAGFSRHVPQLMTALDVYVCPSHSESLPLTILEAMSAARPVVATSVGGIPEIIRPHETGLLVPPRQPAALADAIAEILDQPALAIRLGQAARELVLQEFSPQQQTEKVIGLYRQLLTQPQRQPHPQAWAA